jgi:hypothetical protein
VNELRYVALVSLNGWNVTPQWMERDNNCLHYPIWKSSRFVATTSGLSGVWFSVMYSASSAQPPWFRVNITFHPHKSGVWCRQTPGGWRKQILVKDIWKIPLFITREVATTGEVAIRGSTARHGTVHNTIQQNSMEQHISQKKIVKQCKV